MPTLTCWVPSISKRQNFTYMYKPRTKKRKECNEAGERETESGGGGGGGTDRERERKRERKNVSEECKM